MGFRPGEKRADQTTLASEVIQKYLVDREFLIGDQQKSDEGGDTTFTLDFSADNVASIPIKIIARDRVRQVLFIAACPYVVPETHKYAMIGKLSELNRMVSIGTFILSTDGHVLSFRSGVDFLDAAVDLTQGIIDCQMKLTLETLDELIPEIMEFLFSPDNPPQTLEEYFKAKTTGLQ